MLLGYLFVRAIPLPPSEEHGHVDESENVVGVDEEQGLLDTLEDPSTL